MTRRNWCFGRTFGSERFQEELYEKMAASDGCTLYDKDLWPPILKYDPLNGCIMEYPCGLGNPYTLNGLHRQARGLLAGDRRLAREKAEALRAEVVRQMLELTSVLSVIMIDNNG